MDGGIVVESVDQVEKLPKIRVKEETKAAETSEPCPSLLLAEGGFV